MVASAAEPLLTHYDRHARAMPWRSPPGSAPPEPYLVWLSEVMLQQTTVATVGPRFRRFLARWPTVDALAAASDDDVLREWAGLGYYARARNLIACARTVAARGGFPRTEAELRELPGLGAYTAAAIAAIAFGQRAVVVDTNVARVVARYHGIQRPLDQAREEIRKLADAITPADRPGDFAQAMMDLGATICRPKNPNASAGTAMASPGGSNAEARCGWSAARPRGCSAGWRRCPGPTGATSRPPRRHWQRCRTASPISRSTCTLSRAPTRPATAGGSR
jgi:A/G-specific adenine glycosylase